MKKPLVIILSLLAVCIIMCACQSSGYDKSSANEEEHTSFGDWMLAKEVDDFGDVVEDSDYVVLKTIAFGDFSNMATSGSDLRVEIFNTIAEGSHLFYFDLFEYNKTAPATYYDDSEITMKAKMGDTITSYSMIGLPPNGSIFLGYKNEDGNDIFDELYAGNDVRCIIYIDNSQYNFTISSDGFQEICAEAQKKKDEIAEKNRIKDPSSVVDTVLTPDCGNAKLYEMYQFLADNREDYHVMTDEEIKKEIDGDFYYFSMRDYSGAITTDRDIMNYSDNTRTQKVYLKEDEDHNITAEETHWEREFTYSDGIITISGSKSQSQLRKMADGYYVAYSFDGTDYTIPSVVMMKGHETEAGHFDFDYPLKKADS